MAKKGRRAPITRPIRNLFGAVTRPLRDLGFRGRNKSDAAKFGASRMSAEERSDRSRRGWETRKARQREAALYAEMRHDEKSRAGSKGAAHSKESRRSKAPRRPEFDPRRWKPGEPIPF